MNGRVKISWVKANWQWLRIAIVLSAAFLLTRLILGWAMMSVAGQTTWTPEVPAGAGVEVPKARNLINKKLVALTFDDGPSAETTTQLLEVLKAEQAVATFFVLGSRAQANPEIVRQEIINGNEVASHTMNHQNLTALTDRELTSEIDDARAVIQGVGGEKVAVLTRAPYGAVDARVLSYLKTPSILWTVDTLDWKTRNKEEIKNEILANVFDGAIVLMHDIYGETVDATGDVINILREQGYEFVTVSEMAQLRGVVLEQGINYGSFKP